MNIKRDLEHMLRQKLTETQAKKRKKDFYANDSYSANKYDYKIEKSCKTSMENHNSFYLIRMIINLCKAYECLWTVEEQNQFRKVVQCFEKFLILLDVVAIHVWSISTIHIHTPCKSFNPKWLIIFRKETCFKVSIHLQTALLCFPLPSDYLLSIRLIYTIAI